MQRWAIGSGCRTTSGADRPIAAVSVVECVVLRVTIGRTGGRRLDADGIREEIARARVEVVVPAIGNRRTPIPNDRVQYRWRSLIERLISKLNNWRRVAIRYDTTAESYLGFVTLALVKLWLPLVHDD